MVAAQELDIEEVKLARRGRHGEWSTMTDHGPIVVEDDKASAMTGCGSNVEMDDSRHVSEKKSEIIPVYHHACFGDELDDSDMAEADAEGHSASAGPPPASTGQLAAAPTDSQPPAAGPAGASSSPATPCHPVASVALAPLRQVKDRQGLR